MDSVANFILKINEDMERLIVPKSVSQNVVIDLNTTLSLKSRYTGSMPPPTVGRFTVTGARSGSDV